MPTRSAASRRPTTQPWSSARRRRPVPYRSAWRCRPRRRSRRTRRTPDARLGVAEGHDDNYGRFLVSTGPYMFEGTDQLDFSAPADDQQPVSGYDVGRSIVLVRNPSYDPDSDDLREGYVDRVEITIGGDENDLALKVDAGELDMVYDGVPPAQQVRRHSSDPNLQDQIHSDPSDAVRFIEMNLAVPPFDDVSVRRALNFALDKEGYRQLRGGAPVGELPPHLFLHNLHP